MTQKSRNAPPLSWAQFFRYADATDRAFLTAGAVVAIVTGLSWNLLTIAFGDVVDVFVAFERSQRNQTLISAESRDDFLAEVYFFSAALFGLWALNAVCNYLIMVLFPLAAASQSRAIKRLYFASLMRQEMAFFDTNADDFASRVTADMKRVEEGMNEKLGLAVYNASTAVIAVATAFFYGWKLTLIIISLLPFLAFGTSVMNKVQASFARKEVEAYAAAGQVAEEAIAGIRTVVAFGGQQVESRRYARHLEPALRSGIRRNLMTGLGNGLMFACLYAGLALGIWFGVQMIIESDGQYTIGTIVIVFWCVSGAGFSIGGAAPHFEAVAVARATAARVYAVIERRPVIDVASEAGARPEDVKAELELRDIDFAYPSRPEVRVLNGFSLRVRAGERVALVGASGSGKSTVVGLLQRFYDPNSGAVLVDGRDVRDWNVAYLRRQMGVVGQEPVLFDASIRENIALGAHAKLVEPIDVERAAQTANAAEFIARLPDGFETRVGDRGAQLSGGQKQRIAIARALINAPKLLLLDEATSALDRQSEAVVQAALDAAAAGRTTVVVAHRLSTVQNCDRIVVMEAGKVVEEGTHAQLMAKEALYWRLVRQQHDANDDNDDTPDDRESVVVETEEEEEAEGEEGPQDEEEALKKFSQRRLWRLVWRDRWLVALGLFLSLAYGLIVPIYAFIFGAFVEVFATAEDARDIWRRSHVFAFYYVGIAGAVGVISVAQMTALGVAGERLTLRLRRLAFDAILRQEMQWFDKPDNSCGALCARLSADAANVQGASGARLAIICQALSTFVTSAVLGFALSWQLSLVAMLFIPFILIGSAVSASVDSWELKHSKQTLETATKVAVEALSAVRTVASLQREQHFCDRFQRIVEQNARTARKKTLVRALTLASSLSVVFLSYAVVFLFGGLLASRRALTSGDFFIIIETLIYGSMTVGQSSVFTQDYRKAKIAAANIFRLLDRRSREHSPQTPLQTPPAGLEGNIRFRDVHFQYPARPEARILRGLSLDIRAGQTVALVGASGCGKSTSVQLLERFYDVSRGLIEVDGRDVTQLDRHWLRRQMAVVSQEPTLFSGSIHDNIAYGDNTRAVSAAEVVKAAKAAGVHDFVQSLPQQYDTRVGARGAQLSGGQKQRVAIARALLRRPRVLLLDEATSALDATSERAVQMALESAAAGRTCLVIAHRLSTVRAAHRIVVVQRGRVVEEGDHETLIAKRGVYFRLNSY